MAENADSVIVSVETQLDKASNAAAVAQFDQSMDKIKASASAAEVALRRLFDPAGYRQDRLAQQIRGTGQAVEDAFGRPMLNATTRTRQLGIQIGQLGSQMANGGNALMAITQQASDFAYVLAGTQGVAGRVATFFSGPWGAALLAAGLLITNLAAAHMDADDKAEKHRKSEKTLMEAIRDLEKQTREAIQSTQERNSLTELTAQHELAAAIATRNHTIAILNEAIAQEKLNEARIKEASLDPRIAGPLQGENESLNRRIRDLETFLKMNEAALGLAQTALASAQIPRLLQEATEKTDAAAKATGEYERAIAKLNEQYQHHQISDDVFRKEAERLMRVRDAALEAARAQKEHASAVRGVEEAYKFRMPVEGQITSGFGSRTPPKKGASSFHPAIDIAAPLGTPVHAAAPGVVITAGRMGGLGNVVIVDHGGGTISEYGHLSAIIATKGQEVTPDTVIGKVGSTGISTGPHLDYRVKVGGKYVDPRTGTFPIDSVAAGSKTIEVMQAQAEAEQRQNDTFNAEMLRLQEQMLAASKNRLGSMEEQLQANEAQVLIDRDQQIQAYEAASAQGRINGEQAKLLIAKANEVATAKTMKLYLDEGLRKAQLAAQLDQDRAGIAVENARFEQDQARTIQDRRAAAYRVLDAELELERLKQQQILDNTKIGSVEHERAQLALADLQRRREQGQARIATDPSFMLPGQRFLAGLKPWGEEVEQAGVDTLVRFNDELAKAITGAETLGEAFKNTADLIVEQLARIAIQELIIKPIASLLFGGSGGGGAAGILSFLGGLFGGGGGAPHFTPSNPGVGFAGGGTYRAGQVVTVGESGKEAFVAGVDGTIVPNNALARTFGGGMAGGFRIEVAPSRYFDVVVREVTAPMVAEGSMRAAQGGSVLAQQSLGKSAIHRLE